MKRVDRLFFDKHFDDFQRIFPDVVIGGFKA